MTFSNHDLKELKRATKKSCDVTLPGNMGVALIRRLEAAEKALWLVYQGFGGYVLKDAIIAWLDSIEKESD